LEFDIYDEIKDINIKEMLSLVCIWWN